MKTFSVEQFTYFFYVATACSICSRLFKSATATMLQGADNRRRKKLLDCTTATIKLHFITSSRTSGRPTSILSFFFLFFFCKTKKIDGTTWANEYTFFFTRYIDNELFRFIYFFFTKYSIVIDTCKFTECIYSEWDSIS